MSNGRLVSIDSSTNKTGAALYVGGKLKEYDLIDLSKSGLTIDPRIDEMGKRIMKLLSYWQPTMVYIEEPKGHNNVELVRKLSTILGIVRGWCIQNGVYFEEIKPTVWRKYIGFDQGGKKRDELKAASIDYVRKTFGIEVNDDTADAICIGGAIINMYGEN